MENSLDWIKLCFSSRYFVSFQGVVVFVWGGLGWLGIEIGCGGGVRFISVRRFSCSSAEVEEVR